MKKLKTKWEFGGKEIDAFVHISNITIRKKTRPYRRGSGSGGVGPNGEQTPAPDFSSLIEYYISEDEEGENPISRGQMEDKFDFNINGTNSIKDFAVNNLKKNKHLKNIREED